MSACNNTVVRPALGVTAGLLFGECYDDNDCVRLGSAAICRRGSDGYLKGSCTRPCIDRTECEYNGTHHHCESQVTYNRIIGYTPYQTGSTDAGVSDGGVRGSYCQQFCRMPTDCGRAGYSCEILNDTSTGAEPVGTCVPICNSDADCGLNSECDEASGVCVGVGRSRTVGAAIGAACTSANACRSSFCIQEQTSGAWSGGYCARNCLLPAGYVSGNDFFNQGDSLPNGGCPDDGICAPNGPDFAGAQGVCFKRCTVAADCGRTGYTCQRRFQVGTDGNGAAVLSRMFETGRCWPGA